MHAVAAVGYYHGFGTTNPLLSLIWNTARGGVPFESFGLAALVILFLMAATSHDFWLRNLGARAWKRLHMLVYGAYFLLFAHVTLGALRTDRGWAAAAALVAGLGALVTLHVAAGVREARRDRPAASAGDEGWLDAGPVGEIPEDRARIVSTAGGARIAVIRHAGKVSAMVNVCAHQGGPVGEGRVIDGCLTCPWHGWQYRAEDGCSPPPFKEKLATHAVRITAGRVRVKASPEPIGAPAAPAAIEEDGS